jgi:N-acetylmuramic acid 6-phosphate etherase
MSTTEQRNPASKGIDKNSVRDILEIINHEDMKIATAIQSQLPQIEDAVLKIISTLQSGRNVYLVGAGSSGRLCVLEASEIPPTFGFSPDRIRVVIAGGVEAFYASIEAVEDDKASAAIEMEHVGVKHSDLVIGVAASGSTPFVLGAIEKAKELGAHTVGLSCNKDTPLSRLADTTIEIIVGPEIVAGSTRMKAGTAQKMVLNMMTTTAMMKLGLVYDGYMIGVQATNKKLKDRSKRILAEITGVSQDKIETLLRLTNWDVRVALIVIMTDLSPEDAAKELETHTLREILNGGRL